MHMCLKLMGQCWLGSCVVSDHTPMYRNVVSSCGWMAIKHVVGVNCKMGSRSECWVCTKYDAITTPP